MDGQQWKQLTVTYNVREYKDSDYFDLLDMVENFIKKELPEELRTYDSKVVNSTIDSLKQNGKILMLVDNKDNSIGTLGCLFTQLLFSKKRIATEIAFWINKEHRNQQASNLLITKYEEWAKENNCDLITLMSVDNESKDKVDYLYKKHNYKPSEISYIKEL